MNPRILATMGLIALIASDALAADKSADAVAQLQARYQQWQTQMREQHPTTSAMNNRAMWEKFNLTLDADGESLSPFVSLSSSEPLPASDAREPDSQQSM